MRRALRAERAAGAPGLNLDEDQCGAVQGDDVELARGEADVAPDDPPARALQPGGDQPLGAAAEALSGERHRLADWPADAVGARVDRNGSVTPM